ncbi:hypothetical protein ACFFRR_005798 [Megaselia abdita]
MKKSFKSVQSIFKAFEESLNVEESNCVCDTETVVKKTSRALRKATVEQSQVNKRKNAKSNLAIGTGTIPKTRVLPPTSPLVIPNGTSSPAFVTVTRGKRRTATVTKQLPTLTSPQEETINSSKDLTLANVEAATKEIAPTFSEVVSGEGSQQQLQKDNEKASQSDKFQQVRRLKLAQRTKFKAMFIANLDEHLTEKDLYDYLFDEGGQRIVQQLKIFRLNTKRKRESAFKLICPEILYDEIMNLWEEGVTVRDFYYNNSEHIDNQPKN